MINLKSIEIDGFILENQKLKLEFYESNVICIFGDNGSGKTTFLEILYAIFAKDETILIKYNVKNIKIDFFNKAKNSIFIKKVAKNSYDWGENLCRNSILLGIGRGIHSKSKFIDKYILWKFFENSKSLKKYKDNFEDFDNFSKTLSKDLYYYLNNKDKTDSSRKDYEIERLDKQKNIYLPNIEINMIKELLLYKYQNTLGVTKSKIIEALLKTISQNINHNVEIICEELDIEKLLDNKNLIIEASKEIDNFPDDLIKDIEFLEKDINHIDKLESQQLRYSMLVNILETLNDEFKIFQKIKEFIYEFNEYLLYDKKIVIKNNEIYIEDKNSKHSLDKLSSGERHMLTFLATILLIGETKDFILIDEPEISLNVNWQVKILSVIAKLAPNSQIIVATHSPLVVRKYSKSVIGIEPEATYE